MKLLWHSNSPWTRTGYGNQTAVFVPRLRAKGYDVAISAFYGLNGAPLKWQDVMVYPQRADLYGNDVLTDHARHRFGGNLTDGLILTLLDVWVLSPALFTNVNAASWVPVDHDPPPHRVQHFFRHSDSVPIAMSRFGERLLHEFEPLYVPHGIDTEVFRPQDKTEAKEKLGLPTDRFIVGMVAANKGNPSRKSFPEAVQAFAELKKKHPDVLLYLHTEASGYAEGVNLPKLLAACGIGPDDVRFPDQYRLTVLGYSDEHMANVYSAIDVLLNPAAGEGFGIPVIEAQACGTPVIVTDFSAMSEVCGAGWKVNGQRVWTFQESWQVVPSVKEIVWALNDAYDRAPRLADEARAHGLEYDADLVTDKYWLPALEALEERFAAREPKAVAA